MSKRGKNRHVPPVQPRPPRRTGKGTKPCPDCHGMGVVTNRNGVVVFCSTCGGRRRIPE